MAAYALIMTIMIMMMRLYPNDPKDITLPYVNTHANQRNTCIPHHMHIPFLFTMNYLIQFHIHRQYKRERQNNKKHSEGRGHG